MALTGALGSAAARVYHLARMPPARRLLGLGSGVGLVVANMVGAGVFISAGFMVQDMGPGTVLAAWVVGAIIVLAVWGFIDRRRAAA